MTQPVRIGFVGCGSVMQGSYTPHAQLLARQGLVAELLKDVPGARGANIGLVVREQPRFDQHQPRQAHVLHGTRSPADISGMTGIDQDDTNVLQQGRRSRTL